MPIAVARLNRRGPCPICGARDLTCQWRVLYAAPDYDRLTRLHVCADIHGQGGQPLKPIMFCHSVVLKSENTITAPSVIWMPPRAR